MNVKDITKGMAVRVTSQTGIVEYAVVDSVIDRDFPTVYVTYRDRTRGSVQPSQVDPCSGCIALASISLTIQCNAHRSMFESTDARLIRLATEAGHALTGTPSEQAMQAERLLGARPIIID